MSQQTLTVPDIGGAEDAEVIEVCVAVGDRVEAEQSLIVLESDKASMEVPAELAGTVVEVLVKEGDGLAEGSAIVIIEAEAEAESDTEAAAAAEAVVDAAAESEPVVEPVVASEPAAVAAPAQLEQTIPVPDIGTDDAVEVIEIMVAVGDIVAEGDSLIVLESDKASMEIPAPFAGEITALKVSIGDEVTQGIVIADIKTEAPVLVQSAPVKSAPTVAETAAVAVAPAPAVTAAVESVAAPVVGGEVYAGPAVRKLAREFGVDLARVEGSGPKGRILKDDLQDYVKNAISGEGSGPSAGAGIPPIPEVDFAAFGEVDVQPRSKIDKLTAANLHRSWLNVPRVTQFDEVDISELEEFRASMKAEGERRGVKLTPLPFLLKACAAALIDNPKLNASLSSDGESLVYKKYVHIGMAVDTTAGLVVPVVRNVDQKNLWQLAEETAELAEKARTRKLKLQDMQGASFSISSLGNIGGTGFTPIINAPEVAILGVSRLAIKPVWNGTEFEPRKMLPLALAYDHRVVNGGDGGRFMTQLGVVLADIRRLLL